MAWGRCQVVWQIAPVPADIVNPPIRKVIHNILDQAERLRRRQTFACRHLGQRGEDKPVFHPRISPFHCGAGTGGKVGGFRSGYVNAA
jgi:hypothetical protein